MIPCPNCNGTGSNFAPYMHKESGLKLAEVWTCKVCGGLKMVADGKSESIADEFARRSDDDGDVFGAWCKVNAAAILAAMHSARPEAECRVARWCPKPRPDEQCIRCNRFADRQSQPQKDAE